MLIYRFTAPEMWAFTRT